MRNLTIKRRWSFAARGATMKAYIEDRSGDTFINNVRCLELGTLKNGEEKTFQVEDGARRVFVKAEKSKDDFLYDFYKLPKGSDDVSLSGRNKFAPASGNAFRFDGNESPEMAEKRKKTVLRAVLITLAAIAAAVLVGFLLVKFVLFRDNTPKPKTFRVQEMTITLTEAFWEEDMREYGCAACFDSEDMAVFVVKDRFYDLPELEGLTLVEYGERLIEGNGFENVEVKTTGGYVWYERDFRDEDGTVAHFVSYLFRSMEGFWMVEFGADLDYFTENADVIAAYADSITIASS